MKTKKTKGQQAEIPEAFYLEREKAEDGARTQTELDRAKEDQKANAEFQAKHQMEFCLS